VPVVSPQWTGRVAGRKREDGDLPAQHSADVFPLSSTEIAVSGIPVALSFSGKRQTTPCSIRRDHRHSETPGIKRENWT
jgi:hypothetical protein